MTGSRRRSNKRRAKNELQRIALAYLEAGLVPLRLRLDGSKRPLINWGDYQHTRPTRRIVSAWFEEPPGIGIICGRVSGGLEVLDFDDPSTYPPWREAIAEGLRSRLVVIRTAGGGYHVAYRCSEIAGNTRIACWEQPPEDGSKVVRIETRGKGGYIVAPGSPAEVHSTGRPYRVISTRQLEDVATITPEERRQLWKAAASFDQRRSRSEKVEQRLQHRRRARWQRQRPARQRGRLLPGEDFDRRADWAKILEPHGWTWVGGGYWRRPGKSDGHSASLFTNDDGIELLTVYSTNADPLEPGTYGPFRAFAALNHRGDLRAAARDLRRHGYGSHGKGVRR